MHRIKAFLSPANRLVAFNEVFEGTKNGFLNLINGDIPPDAQDRFSFGTVYGGEMTRHGERALSFIKGGFWNFSTMDKDIMFKVYEGIARNEEFAFGMYVDSVENITCNFTSGLNYVTCHPGIALRRFKPEGGVHNLTLLNEGEDFLQELENNTRERVKRLAPDLNHHDIYINTVEGEVYKRKSALVEGSYHLFNEGTFSIEAEKEVMDLISCVGLGDLTYLGFGYVAQTFDPRGKRFSDRPLRPNEIRRTSDGYIRGESLREDYDASTQRDEY